ncbi:hypothetical protein [Amycolatopsis rifamycinica]|uniref:Uncharacterized protein n=1 Tax=Amycolatopsis rifamycinica TaxID=287986 RepID=A0A066U306_9PSEU|nr:hypothetical protein [Amycolatopsis rifamycinica]KDN18603.1 hypothetical protein DV20_28845 [Amycolatopsis rifamycinica]
MASADGAPPAPPPGHLPQWQVQGLNLLAIGAGTNGLYDAMHPLLVAAVVAVALFVHLLGRLDPEREIATHLPRALLHLTVAGIGLVVATPASWTGPMAVASAVFAVCAALAARDRASALATLLGTSGFALGVVVAAESAQIGDPLGRVLITGCAVGVALLGLSCLLNRHRLVGPGGVGVHTLMTMPMTWARLSVLGVFGVIAGCTLIGDHVVVALLCVVGGASWVGAAVVFSFMDRRDALAGTLLTVTGWSVTGLGWVAFSSREFVGGLVCITTGATLVVAGLWLLDSAGFTSWLRRQFKPSRTT